jgi:hypothetical protein
LLFDFAESDKRRTAGLRSHAAAIGDRSLRSRHAQAFDAAISDTSRLGSDFLNLSG